MSFEERLPNAMREATANLAPPDDLPFRGMTRGRRMRRARTLRIAAAAGMAAAALIAAGGLVEANTGDGRSGTAVTAGTVPMPSLSGPAGAPVNATDLRQILMALMPPGGKLTHARATAGEGASLVYDDGKGPSAITVMFARPPARTIADQAGCRRAAAGDRCRTTTLPDGSLLTIDQGHDDPKSHPYEEDWSATLVGKNDGLIDIEEYNSAGEKSGAGTTRQHPVLTPDQLRAVVTAPVWARVIASLPKPPPEGSSGVPGGMPSGRIIRIVTGLLPRGVHTLHPHGANGLGEIGLVDGRGTTALGVSVAVTGHRTSVCSNDGSTCTHTVRPDGASVVVVQRPGRPGSGIVTWSVTVNYPNGLEVSANESNGPLSQGPRTRQAPELTIAQLTRIALDPAWKG